MIHRYTNWRIRVGCVCLTLALAGCSSDDGPTSTPSAGEPPGAEPSVTASAQPSGPATGVRGIVAYRSSSASVVMLDERTGATTPTPIVNTAAFANTDCPWPARYRYSRDLKFETAAPPKNPDGSRDVGYTDLSTRQTTLVTKGQNAGAFSSTTHEYVSPIFSQLSDTLWYAELQGGQPARLFKYDLHTRLTSEVPNTTLTATQGFRLDHRDQPTTERECHRNQTSPAATAASVDFIGTGGDFCAGLKPAVFVRVRQRDKRRDDCMPVENLETVIASVRTRCSTGPTSGVRRQPLRSKAEPRSGSSQI